MIWSLLVLNHVLMFLFCASCVSVCSLGGCVSSCCFCFVFFCRCVCLLSISVLSNMSLFVSLACHMCMVASWVNVFLSAVIVLSLFLRCVLAVFTCLGPCACCVCFVCHLFMFASWVYVFLPVVFVLSCFVVLVCLRSLSAWAHVWLFL